MNDDSQVLLTTVEEVQRSLSLSRTKVYELMKTGELESVKIGRRRLILVQAVHEYIDSLRAAGASA